MDEGISDLDDQTSRISFKILGGVLPYSQSFSRLGTGLTETFSPLRAVTTKLLFSYDVISRLSISSGLNYSLISELFQYKGKYIVDSQNNYFSEVIENDVLSSFSGAGGDDYVYSLVDAEIRSIMTIRL